MDETELDRIVSNSDACLFHDDADLDAFRVRDCI